MISAIRHVAALQPYALAALSVPVGVPLVSLAQNESLRPPSPKAIGAATAAMTQAHLYPDPDWTELRRALSQLHDIPRDAILCANGSMELIVALAQAFADSQNEVLAPAHAYPFFQSAAHLAQAPFRTAPEREMTVSVDALLKKVRPRTRIVFLANPGNPTGTRISRAELLRLRHNLRDDILLVIDEAYGEFADDLEAPMFDLVERGDTVILRTFSKAYGLAGMRVGWGAFPPEIAHQMRKIMNPNNVSVAGQAAALAALKDQEYMQDTRAQTARLRDEFIANLRAAGFEAPDSFTNFVLLKFGEKSKMQSCYAALQDKGVIARAQAGAGLPDCLRITVAQADQMDLAVMILKSWAAGDLR